MENNDNKNTMASCDWFSRVYFLGIGGIGMSALARYFVAQGYLVAGYDRTPSEITRQLEGLGVEVSYTDDAATLPEGFREPNRTLVVRTPAVPEDSLIYGWFRDNAFRIHKRAEVLGWITRSHGMRALCVAGTHGKTTTSTLLAHLLYLSETGTNAFLGGISKNYGTNLLLQHDSSNVVVEADEYDRSFHHLRPTLAIITATDPDHLDIYGTAEAYRESFSIFTSLIRKGGVLIRKKGIQLETRLQEGVREYTYGVVDGGATGEQLPPEEVPDFYADHIRFQDEKLFFDFHAPQMMLPDIELGVPVWINIENAVAAMAAAWLSGTSEQVLRLGVQSFRGTLRRFNILLQNEHLALVDDYAHHPEELRQSILSIRRLYPSRQLIGIFQPHLYSRTRDFYRDFAEVLSMLDSVVLLPIYPAREEPIEGVSSALILDALTCENKFLCQKEELAEVVRNIAAADSRAKAFLTLGAGDIDQLTDGVKAALEEVES